MSTLERLIGQDEDMVVITTPPEDELLKRIEGSRLKDKSQRFLKENYFFEFLEEVARIQRGKILTDSSQDYEINPRPGWLYSDESSYISVLWEEEEVEEDIYAAKALCVEALPNGTIIVKGSIIGSTVLTEKDWRGEIMTQINALSKASKNPMYVFYQNLEKEDINFSTDQRLLF